MCIRDRIEANPNQPRREFDDEALHELAESIKAIGIIQPVSYTHLNQKKNADSDETSKKDEGSEENKNE